MSVLVAAFDGAWQGAALCATAYLALRLLRRPNAATTFAVWAVVWAVCVALPIANYFLAARQPQQRALPLPISARSSSNSVFARDASPGEHPTRPVATASGRTSAALGTLLAGAPTILWVFAGVAAVRVAVVVRDLLSMIAARRRVRRIVPPAALRRSVRRPAWRPVEFAVSNEFSSPCVLGFWPALVVIPERLLRGPEQQLVSVGLHEYEHAHRFDDVQNVVMRLVGALAFFSPGVLVAARLLALYREQICDDAALAGSGDAVSYATTLADMAELVQTRRVPVPCLIFGRKHLVRRIAALLDAAASHSLHLNRGFVYAATVVTVLAGTLVVQVRVPVVADTLARVPVADVRGRETAASAAGTFTGTFALGRCAAAGQVRLQLDYRRVSRGSVHSDDVSGCVPVATLHGIGTTDLTSGAAHRTFAIVRDPGTIQAEGQVGDGRGSGTWTFAASPSFAAELDRRGVGTPTAAQQFQLMMLSFQFNTLDALMRNGFTRPTIADVLLMGELGIANDLIDAVGGLPGRPKTIDSLNQVKELGTTASYIAALARLGYRPAVEDLIRLKQVGVTPEWIKRVQSRGSAHPSAGDLIRMKEQGY